MARAVRSGSRVDAALLGGCALLALFATVLPTTVREAVAASLRRTVVAPLLTLQQRAERARNAFVDRDAVTARIDSLTMRSQAITALSAENVRLRELLSLGRQLQWGFVSAEAIQGQGLGVSDDHSLALSVGASSGVRPRAPIVSPAGLVGQVTSVDRNTSLAIMWTNPDFRASAMAADGSAYGIVKSHLGDEPERYLMELRGVPFRDALKPGTLIVSSGIGGVFPRGIPIGYIVGEVKTTEQWSRTYLLRPAVRPSDVTNVLVLSPERVSDSLSGIWTSPAGAEAAVRRIVQAGDSIVRDSLAAVDARQRAADSAAQAQRLADSVARAPAAAPMSPADTSSAVTRAPNARPDSAAARRAAARRDAARRDTTRRPPTRPRR